MNPKPTTIRADDLAHEAVPLMTERRSPRGPADVERIGVRWASSTSDLRAMAQKRLERRASW